MLSDMQSVVPKVLIAAIMALAVFLYLYQLGAQPLYDYDEAQYAIITQEVVAAGSWPTLTFLGNPYFEKPPLYFWLAAIPVSIFGESEWTLRLPSALAGILLVGAVMLLAYELGRSQGVALTQITAPKAAPFDSPFLIAALAGAIELTMSPVLDTARQMRLDVLVTLWIVLASYAFVRGLRYSKWFLGFGLFAGLAVMTKSVIAVFAFVAAAAFVLLQGESLSERLAFLRQKNFWRGIGVFAAVALPWQVYELARWGREFWNTYVGFTIWERTVRPVFTESITNEEYWWYLTSFGFPWTQVFVCGAIVLLAISPLVPRQYMRAPAACATIVLSVIAAFFAATTKAPTYLLPLYPFAAVAIALTAVPALAYMGRQRLGVVLGTSCLTALLVIGMQTTLYNGYHANPYYAEPDALAREEKAIGTMLARQAMNVLYAYGDPLPPLGAVMYYSGNHRPLRLAAGDESPSPGSLLLLRSQAIAGFQAQFPAISTLTAYEGRFLAVLQVRER